MALMPTDSQRRYALVTGGGSGLGRAFCLRLARAGWYVAVTDIDGAAADETLGLLTTEGGHGQTEQLDVTDAEAWIALSEKLREDWPRLNLLINNAGVCCAGEVGVAPLEHAMRVLDINLRGVLCGCHTMVPWLKQTAPGGHILNIASIFGIIAPPTMAAYCASKAAVVTLSESLYGELVPHKIGVTVAVPGFFPTNLLVNGQFDEIAYRNIASNYMAQSPLTADEVVRQTMTAVERGKLYVALGRRARWYWRLKRLFPSGVTQMAAYQYRHQIQKQAKNNI